jgi:2-polyprenyl-6-methoxyphenol hydroxylase-like FAD-dependent oxidoreductase
VSHQADDAFLVDPVYRARVDGAILTERGVSVLRRLVRGVPGDVAPHPSRKERSMKAVVAGGGIGGLAAAVALHRRGIDVIVLERAGQPDTAGAALSLWPNALRGLDQLGIGDQVRQHATLGGNSGIRRPDGRWLARARLGRAIETRFGDPLVIVHRATLAQLLSGQLPPGTIRYATTVTGVQPGELAAAASVHTIDGDQHADLVVAADGIRSTLRTALFPGTPGPRYAGYTAWRMIVDDPGGTEPAETWGPDGQRFAIVPIADGRCYCYATADIPAGTAFDDDAAELRRRFASWHTPIGALLAPLTRHDVLRNDIEELPPLPAMHRARVALLGDAAHAMTPDLGQGACQAIEDAVVLAASVSPHDPTTVNLALQRYTAARLPRTTAIGHRSRTAGALYHRPSPMRWTAARLMNLLPPGAIARSLSPVVDWQPPTVDVPR